MTVKTAAVIVAAGNSTRMGRSKPFLLVGNKPLIAYTLEAFESCDAISQIVLVARGDEIEAMRQIAAEYRITKLTAVVEGGAIRQDSVHNGVAVCTDAEYVAIHDGARPAVTPILIEKAVDAAMKYGACTLAVPSKDTVKIGDAKAMVISTPDRATLWNIQTPQVFEKTLYEYAYQYATENGLELTDDCQLIEAIGKPVKLVKADYTNIKVTTPDDLPMIERILL